MSRSDAIIEALKNAPKGQEDYVAYLYEVLESEQEIDDPSEVFPHAFRFFEDHAQADLGTPGPLVHFLERFHPRYLDELCQSIARRPTFLTTWMLNRILNIEPPGPNRNRLIGLLRTAADHPLATGVVREQSQQFLSHQRNV